MPTLGITVRFPLGFYQGHRPDGSVDPFPDPLRLQSALLNAASVGASSRSLDESAADGTSGRALDALKWLEENPPVGIELPDHQWLASKTKGFAYRNVSSVNTKHKVEKRKISDGVALSGRIGYLWNDVPAVVKEEIGQLIQDVAYLGEAQSIAILELADVEPSLVLAQGMSPFASGGTQVSIALPGRTEYLCESHRKQYPAKKPTTSKDKATGSELPISAPKTDQFCGIARYIQVQAEMSDSPWESAILLGVSGPTIPRRERVGFCVAVHKAIVKAVGYGASSFITGRYATGVKRPSNRLAIQYLPGAVLREHATPALNLSESKIALMIPRGTQEQEIQELALALSAVNTIWTRSLGRRRVFFNGHIVSTRGFWARSAQQQSVWDTEMPAVPETRPVSKKFSAGEWSLGDSASLSAGFVWKDDLNVDGHGQSRYVALRDAAVAHGVQVLRAVAQTTHVTSYFHKLPNGVTARPWNGTIDLGDLANPRDLVAIGQSRHVGGGLLIPSEALVDRKGENV